MNVIQFSVTNIWLGLQSNGSAFEWSNGAVYYPDASNFVSGYQEPDCIVASKPSSWDTSNVLLWYSLSCSQRHGVICEKKPVRGINSKFIFSYFNDCDGIIHKLSLVFKTKIMTICFLNVIYVVQVITILKFQLRTPIIFQ